MRTALLALACALLGGAAGAGVVLALDEDDPPTDRPATAARDQRPLDADGLTPAQIYDRDAPGVVFISAEVVQQTASPFDLLPQEQRGQSTGTGFVIDEEGFILTNAHVVADASQVRVRFSDGRVVAADVRGEDPSTDVALLKVDPERAELDPLSLGASRDVQVGDPTVAIGNPFGLDLTLTTGVVSAKARRIEAPNGFEITDVLQTDAAINPGNSGGPLIDAEGRVIGINSAIRTGGEGGGSIGIGFAVPIDTARRILPELKERGRVERPYLGVTSATVDEAVAGSLGLSVERGALVEAVVPAGPAAEAGVRAGDVMVRIGKDPVGSAEDVGRVLDEHEPGDRVAVEVVRGEDRTTVEATLGRRGS